MLLLWQPYFVHLLELIVVVGENEQIFAIFMLCCKVKQIPKGKVM